jgi:hypothetical protein
MGTTLIIRASIFVKISILRERALMTRMSQLDNVLESKAKG